MSELEVTRLPRRMAEISDIIVTGYIHPDEKAFCLTELNRLTDDWKHEKRWQFIYVNRDGCLAVFIRDLGDAALCRAPQLRLYSFWEDSVAHLQAEAEIQRLRDDYWQRTIEEVKAESTFKQNAMAYFHERWETMHNRSVFGPKFKRERNLPGRRR